MDVMLAPFALGKSHLGDRRFKINLLEGWGCSSMIEHEALGLISSTTGDKKKGKDILLSDGTKPNTTNTQEVAVLSNAGRQNFKDEKGMEIVTWHGSLHSQGKKARYSSLVEIPATLRVLLAFFCHLLETLTDGNNFIGSCNHIPCVERKFL
jgi:hypothetical protein